MDSSVIDVLKKSSEKTGIPYDILYSIVMTESGGNPLAHTKSSLEDSRGLFQVNVFAHPTANASKLFDPQYNADFWTPNLIPSYEEGKKKGLSGSDLAVYVERYGERPQWTSTVESNVRKYYSESTGGKMDNNSGSSGNTNSASTGITGFITEFFNGAKFTLSYAVLLIFLLFALYMIFIKK